MPDWSRGDRIAALKHRQCQRAYCTLDGGMPTPIPKVTRINIEDQPWPLGDVTFGGNALPAGLTRCVGTFSFETWRTVGSDGILHTS